MASITTRQQSLVGQDVCGTCTGEAQDNASAWSMANIWSHCPDHIAPTKSLNLAFY